MIRNKLTGTDRKADRQAGGEKISHVEAAYCLKTNDVTNKRNIKDVP